MPLYDFHCPKCDNRIEVLARFSDIPACSHCDTPMERQVSSIAPAGKSAEIMKSWRARAAREGHTSNFG
ncbi:zinc ribbon domain-containing protein [soil metagenome]